MNRDTHIYTHTHTHYRNQSHSHQTRPSNISHIERNRWPIITQTLYSYPAAVLESGWECVKSCILLHPGYNTRTVEGETQVTDSESWVVLTAVNHSTISQSWISLSMKQVFSGIQSSKISSFNKSCDSMQGKQSLGWSTFLFLGLEGSIYRKWELGGIMKSIYATQKAKSGLEQSKAVLAEVSSLCLTSAFFWACNLIIALKKT